MFWLRNIQLRQEGGELLAVFGQVDGLGTGTQDGYPGRFQGLGQIERGLPAELDDDAGRLFALDHVQDVFQGERFEVQAVGGVVIGGDRLGVAVEHDRLIAQRFERKRRLAAAVIEFDPLADAIWPAAQNQDLMRAAGTGLVLLFVGAVQIGRLGLEFGRAGIHALKGWPHAQSGAHGAHLLGRNRQAQAAHQVAVDKTELFGLAQQIGVREQSVRTLGSAGGFHLGFQGGHLLDLRQEPQVVTGQFRQRGQGHTGAHGAVDGKQPLRGRGGQLVRAGHFRRDAVVWPRAVRGIHADFQGLDGFVERFGEGAPQGHHFADRFHLRAQLSADAGKFLERPARNFDHHVI